VRARAEFEFGVEHRIEPKKPPEQEYNWDRGRHGGAEDITRPQPNIKSNQNEDKNSA
jgi:hypothetical protein